jgi:hypothetical protein
METTHDEESRHYAARGQAAIQNDMEFAWLLAERSTKRSILMELGRIGEPEAIRHVAEHICEMKPHAEEAVALIRRWRNGRPFDAVTVKTGDP